MGVQVQAEYVVVVLVVKFHPSGVSVEYYCHCSHVIHNVVFLRVKQIVSTVVTTVPLKK